jgi:hypothetical protein
MRDKLDMLIAESIAIEAEDAKQAGAVGFMARALTQATMPHRRFMSQFSDARMGLSVWLCWLIQT